MFKFHALVVATVFSLTPFPVHAGQVADNAVAAEKLADQSKFDEALAKLEVAKSLLWEAAPLSIPYYTLVASDPVGFGIYDVRPNIEFKSGEKIVIYTEPTGFAYGRDGEFYLIEMALDLDLRDGSGASLGKKADFGKWTLRSRLPNKEFMGKIDYDFAGIQPGDYEVITTVRDKYADSSFEFATKFKIVP